MDQSGAEHPGKTTRSAVGPEVRMTEIAALLKSLDETAANGGYSTPAPSTHENQLVQVRLGIASSLFTALRCKHAPTAGHSMRVALGCSAWALAMRLPDDQRDGLEVAALLHDVGKIGVPDHILQKPGGLTADETAVIDQHSRMGVEIVSCCSAPLEVTNVIRYAQAWFDGSKRGFDLRGEEIPLGARIVAIVDAFDAMTTDHVYRRAMSRERALVELYEFAGSQFDPALVKQFSDLHESSQLDLHARVSQRWLEALAPDVANRQWQLNLASAEAGRVMSQAMFQQKLLDNMHDGVIFIDSQSQVFLWNQGAERLSGISGGAVYQKDWRPSLLDIRDDRGRLMKDADCPVAMAISSGVQSLQRLSIRGRNGKDAPVDLHTIPVMGRDGTVYGATILLHDVSSETTLEQRCQNLHSQATKDPLTQVANRAEFDRVHAMFIKAHTESNVPCSLIICDIDHFKSVNDTFGHQAGDEVIVGFANLLKSMCRHGDLVARYGGEEFVMLCADCTNATAAARAEQVRRALSELTVAALGSKRITASFGVTENQSGDTPETMLRRADRALYDAKSTGRNRIVQLGTGIEASPVKKRRGWWPFGSIMSSSLMEANLVTEVPLEMAIEKLRGFIADHDARITKTDEDGLVLALDGEKMPLMRRTTDRAAPFVIEMKFSRNRVATKNAQGLAKGMTSQTKIHILIRPRRDRDRRRENAIERARQLLSSLKSYLMARDDAPDSGDALKKAKQKIAPLLKKQELQE